MSERHIFEDPKGRRRRVVPVATAVLVGAVSLALTFFLLSFGISTLASPLRVMHQIQRQLLASDRRKADLMLRRLQPTLRTASATHIAPVPVKPADQVVLGFYAPWEPSSLDSLRAHIGNLSHVAPAWLKLDKEGRLDTSDYDLASNPNNREVVALAKANGVRITPLISNADQDTFQRDRVLKVITDVKTGDALIADLLQRAKENGWQGLNIDFEQLEPADFPAYVAWLQRLSKALGQEKKELSVDVEADTPSATMEQLSRPSDFLVFMAYDEHDEYGPAGPIASIGWVDRELEQALKDVPENKIVLGIGNYAYDWEKGASRAESISFQDAMAAAQGYRDSEPSNSVIEFDPDSFNATFDYQDDNGTEHRVWMLDSLSAYDQWKLGQERGLRGAALWSMGTEDPGVWSILHAGRLTAPLDPNALEKIAFPFEVSYSGQGEILKVVSRPQTGERTVTVDSQSGFIDSVAYQRYATTYLIHKEGRKPGKVVLTFDDGPDPRWTPQILDILRDEKAPATFFCVGENVEANPGLARREYNEGHEIGSHSYTHPNLGAISEERARLELAATKRVIEAVVGRSTILFRPPYNADSQPQTADEVKPVDLADRLGYITVGENIDPNDWDPMIRQDDGSIRPRTADDVVSLVMSDLARRKGTGEEGNIILLHDAGGTRENTVAALPRLTRELRKAGYEIVPLGALLGKDRGAFMPPIPDSERAMIGVDAFVFMGLHLGQLIVTIGFFTAILLGTLRALMVTPLAMIHARHRRTFTAPPVDSVSVLIAAYNEEKTILNTVRSVLANDPPPIEVIVVDDGSADGTYDTLMAEFSGEHRVTILKKENGGKANALNVAIDHAKGDLIACIDADTQLNTDAIGLMSRHFNNSNVGAVAGNVQVGNVLNVLTSWQDVEYRTSQNIERRAYDLLNMITVVPGAIGMWRKSAVVKAGLFQPDTLAEDMDLTWRVRLAGYRIRSEPGAVARTEAPESWGTLFRQRTRWAFGTLQCLWKHRRAMGKHGWFGCLALPGILIFQMLFQILGPLVDLQILITLFMALSSFIGGSPSKELADAHFSEPLRLAIELYALFFLLEFVCGLIAYRMDRSRPLPLVWLVVQRFAYRQLMYLVMLKSIWRALLGGRMAWGKLKRTGTVRAAP